MIRSNLTAEEIAKAFRAALQQGLIREEDTAVIFYDLGFLEERIRHLQSLFPSDTLHAIAIKSNPLIRILKMTRDLDAGVEAATIGEVLLALKTGFSASKIVFDSPVKTMKELEFALEKGIHLNVDNLAELKRIRKITGDNAPVGIIGIRINPQVGIGKIAASSVAGEYSKFGVPIKYFRNELREAFLQNKWLTGVHLHVGSQGCPVDLLIDGIRVLYDFVLEINRKGRHQQIRHFDIGGGLPVSYNHSTHTVSMEEYVERLKNEFPALFTGVPRHASRVTRLITEFGRWINVNSGFTISRVEYVKHDPGTHTAMIHVGADLFLRECLIPSDWKHEYSVLDRFGNLKGRTKDEQGITNYEGRSTNSQMPNAQYNLAGPLCFSGDILARNVHLPEIEEGDYIVIHDTGGYTFSMWSRYNSRFTPRILGFRDDRFEILKERETIDDLINFWK